MNPPFTAEQFLDVIARYNAGVWPMPVVFYLVAAALIVLAVRSSRAGDRWISGILAFLWAWMGVVYHWGYFTAINPAAWAFGALFVLQAAAFLAAGFRGDGLSFRFRPDGYGITGAVMIVYALLAYPVLGALAGHGYPRGPTFGLPCPTGIVTFGILLWASRRVPLWLLVIPVAWSLLGVTAAIRFGIVEDYGLVVAGVLGAVLVFLKNRRVAEPRETELATVEA